MAEPRSVVITGASRGLGFASAVRLHREGWRVVAAMRSPDRGLPLLREALHIQGTPRDDDDRLIGVQLDLLDAGSIAAAAKAIEEAVGAPYALVHNAAATAPYSAAKGAMERWGESMAVEIAPFGLGVTILVTGTYDTDIITDAGTIDDRNFEGPYARLHNTMNSRGRFAMRLARPPQRFTDGLLKALDDRGSFRRHAVGPDASMLLVSSRILPASGMHHMSRVVLGIPKQGSMRDGAWPLTATQKSMAFAAKILPAPVLQRLASLAAKRSKENEE
jgi:NAD(P)-dependent dehydrogenase (short-subunit alcohol dehydrogenase family)